MDISLVNLDLGLWEEHRISIKFIKAAAIFKRANIIQIYYWFSRDAGSSTKCTLKQLLKIWLLPLNACTLIIPSKTCYTLHKASWLSPHPQVSNFYEIVTQAKRHIQNTSYTTDCKLLRKPHIFINAIELVIAEYLGPLSYKTAVLSFSRE